jgi:hypothetical protein
VTLSNYVRAIAAFIFSLEILAGLIVLYTLINIVECLGEHNPKKAFSRFIKNEMLLFSGFMKIFGWIKEMIVWW